MCGIAGYSFALESPVDRTVAARALLAGIAERGADSVGFAWRGDDSKVISKMPSRTAPRSIVTEAGKVGVVQ